MDAAKNLAMLFSNVVLCKGVQSVQVCVSKLSEDSRLFFKGLNKISLKKYLFDSGYLHWLL